jgi:predicted nucleic acid-binding protein
MIYFDTAYLAKCYLNEHGSDEVRRLASEAGRVACCSFGRIELAATIHHNLREGKINQAQSRMIWKQFDLDESNSVWTWLEVSPGLFAEVMQRLRGLKSSVYIRAADALHLACAAEHGFKEIYSNDRHLLAAAVTFKVEGRNIIP